MKMNGFPLGPGKVQEEIDEKEHFPHLFEMEHLNSNDPNLLPSAPILKELGIDPKKYLCGKGPMLSMSPDYFDVNKDNEQKIQKFKRLLATLPDIPDSQIAQSDNSQFPNKIEDNITINVSKTSLFELRAANKIDSDGLEQFELEEIKEINSSPSEFKVKSAFTHSNNEICLSSDGTANETKENLIEDNRWVRTTLNKSPPKAHVNEAVSMMDLVMQMQERQKENSHPNKDKDKTPNDSFSSDDILDVLDSKDDKDSKTKNNVEEEIDSLTEEELTSKIESLLMQNINSADKLSKFEELEECKSREFIIENSSFCNELKMNNSNCIQEIDPNEENTFQYNEELCNNIEDEEAEEIIINIEIQRSDFEGIDFKNNDSSEYTEVQKFEFNE